MVLAANSDKVKTLAGQENAISELARIVRASEADKPVLKAALGALAVLSSDDRNLKKMAAEGLAGLLESSAKDKDERIVSTVGSQPSLLTSNSTAGAFSDAQSDVAPGAKQTNAPFLVRRRCSFASCRSGSVGPQLARRIRCCECAKPKGGVFVHTAAQLALFIPEL